MYATSFFLCVFLDFFTLKEYDNANRRDVGDEKRRKCKKQITKTKRKSKINRENQENIKEFCTHIHVNVTQPQFFLACNHTFIYCSHIHTMCMDTYIHTYIHLNGRWTHCSTDNNFINTHYYPWTYAVKFICMDLHSEMLEYSAPYTIVVIISIFFFLDFRPSALFRLTLLKVRKNNPFSESKQVKFLTKQKNRKFL